MSLNWAFPETKICDTCPIPKSEGNVQPVGPVDAPLCFIGEAAGRTEALQDQPFIGYAGQELDRWLERIEVKRPDVRIGNCLRCHPPGDWLVNAPWEEEALQHCKPDLQMLLGEPHKVFVTLGGTALRQVLDLPRGRSRDAEGGIKVENFHGCPITLPSGAWLVPTFHPSYVLRESRKMLRSVVFDLGVAKECADGTWVPDTPNLVQSPSPDWFELWVEQVLARVRSGEQVWVAADLETPDKEKQTDEGELSKADSSYEILCINLSCSPDEGITVPWMEPYITLTKRLLEAVTFQVYWNAPYDVPRLKAAGIRIDWAHVYDFMDAWHMLHSSLPRGLGFVAPFYSKAGAWKHLGTKSGTYRAMDGVQTLRAAFGVAQDLQSKGLWGAFERHMHSLDQLVLRPAEEAGIPVNRQRLEQFDTMLTVESDKLREELTVPEKIRKVRIMKKPPKTLKTGCTLETVKFYEEVPFCLTCCKVLKKEGHRCARKRDKPSVGWIYDWRLEYHVRQPFNAKSWQQVLLYIEDAGHRAGKNKKTGKATTDKKTIDRLIKTGDPFYQKLKLYRQLTKMQGTYGLNLLKKLDGQDRLHGTFTHGPSTFRLASKNPNLQNLAHHVPFADEFRRCIEARPGKVFVSADFAAIEAVLTGWFMGDPEYIRIAKLGVHARLTSHLVEEPVDLGLPDAELKRIFKKYKTEKQYERPYNLAKRCVHGYNYGLTAFGMRDTFPELFPTKGAAQKIIDVYELMCPKLKEWHKKVRKLAHESGSLGGVAGVDGVVYPHPYGYRHHFYSVIRYQKKGGQWEEKLGEDAKRCVAFLPQSTAGGVLYEACLRLLDRSEAGYIGAACDGETPVRALIHDELFLEVDEEQADAVIGNVRQEMGQAVEQLPCPAEWGIGPYLQVGVAVSVGKNWGPQTHDNPNGMRELDSGQAVAADVFRPEEDEEEEVA